jgi:antitoxin component HigA of HigAB toxin-antitoxin module
MKRNSVLGQILTKSAVSRDYLDLINRFPLVPIKNDAHLKVAHNVIDELSLIGEDGLTAGQADYLAVLGDLTTAYEAKTFEEMTKNVKGLDVLKHLVEEHGLSASDVGRIIGQRELGSKVLRGNRHISREHAKLLGGHFGLPAEIFLR